MHIADAVIPADNLARIQKAQASTLIYIYPDEQHGFDNRV